MIDCDALIVGGGPAGSTCARTLRQAGWKVVVIDRARFPRDKVCGGWLTPEIFGLLELEPCEYRSTGLMLQEITGFRTGVLSSTSVDTQYRRVVSYAIRRCEFDEYLLRRAAVCVRQQTPLTSLHYDGCVWVANDEIRTPVVVGAGGHFCPVARRLRDRSLVPSSVVAKEAEFQIDRRGTTVDANVPELFFCRDLDGYGWCVRKGDFLNVGIGRRGNANFNAHVNQFVSFLESSGKAPCATRMRWRGHAYLACGVGTRPVVSDGLVLVGDAAGVAYPESGEGIKPAIATGRLAGRALIDAGGRYRKEDLLPYQTSVTRLHPPAGSAPPIVRAVQTSIGRTLLRSPAFTRHVVLDRWFLRTAASN